MPQDNDDGIVAALTLLLDGLEVLHARQLFKRALIPAAKQVTFVCDSCGSDKISFSDVSMYWSEEIQDWIVGDWSSATCWCSDCDSEARDMQILLSDKDKNKSILKPSGDTQIT